jgi:hypothetical protein
MVVVKRLELQRPEVLKRAGRDSICQKDTFRITRRPRTQVEEIHRSTFYYEMILGEESDLRIFVKSPADEEQ